MPELLTPWLSAEEWKPQTAPFTLVSPTVPLSHVLKPNCMHWEKGRFPREAASLQACGLLWCISSTQHQLPGSTRGPDWDLTGSAENSPRGLH